VISKRRLQKHGVSLVSVTQDFGEGAAAEFAETIIAAADALHSAENGKHVSRTMLRMRAKASGTAPSRLSAIAPLPSNREAREPRTP